MFYIILHIGTFNFNLYILTVEEKILFGIKYKMYVFPQGHC